MPDSSTNTIAPERGSIIYARVTSLRLGRLFQQKRFYDRPQFVCYEQFRHGSHAYPIEGFCWVQIVNQRGKTLDGTANFTLV